MAAIDHVGGALLTVGASGEPAPGTISSPAKKTSSEDSDWQTKFAANNNPGVGPAGPRGHSAERSSGDPWVAVRHCKQNCVFPFLAKGVQTAADSGVIAGIFVGRTDG